MTQDIVIASPGLTGMKICPRREQINRYNWSAIFTAACYYSDFVWDNDVDTYDRSGWLLENYGVDHRAESIDIVDESKYMLLLLRFA